MTSSDSLVRSVTQETIDRYGRINGDNDIIHYDLEYARRRGFEGTLAHGLMIMGYANELGARRFGESWYTNGEIEVKWVAPVYPGDDVTIDFESDGELIARVGERTVMVGRASINGT